MALQDSKLPDDRMPGCPSSALALCQVPAGILKVLSRLIIKWGCLAGEEDYKIKECERMGRAQEPTNEVNFKNTYI